ncbi:hypothetical protein ASD01_29585 [Ensifer sp. Root423]|uniref:hypothetical protein n=1 Tax=Ensifer sp. Root423 TaxID=1736534 RepID=UPI00071472F6|nr:hypothetical protein [Ensifer sp. Root423]KQX20970.1 hypothetical protein ASD01_29585 [Ensifer sp. Root423]
MGTLTVNGVKVKVDDSFKTLSPEEQEATVNEIAAQIAAGGKGNAPARSGGVDGAMRAMARGTLGIGSYLDELDAATNATLAPLVDPFLPDSYEKLPGKSWGERYDQALDIQRRKDDEYDTDNPKLSTGLQIAGGVGSAGALLRAAPVIGNYALGNTGASVGSRVVSAGVAGGGTGAVQGFGAGEGGMKERAKQAAFETGVGVGTGVAMLPLAAGANKLASSIASKILGESNDALSTVTDQARRYVVDELSDPTKVARYRDSLEQLGPQAMLADVSPEWLGVARGAAARPGTRGLIVDPLNERSAMANTRLRGDVTDNLGPDPIPSRVDRSLASEQNQVRRRYGPAMAERSNYDFTPITDTLDDEIQRLRGPAQRQLRNVRQMLNVNGQDMVTTDPAIAFETRQAIDGILETEQNPKVISALTEARQMIDDGLRASVPRIKEVDGQFAEIARQRDALGEGRSILNNGATAMRPSELDDALRQGAVPQGEMVGPSGVPLRMQQSSLGEVYRAIGTEANDLNALRKTVRGEGDWNREKLGMLFGQDRADNVLNAIDRENVFADTANRVTRGSDTAMGSRFNQFLDEVSKGQEIPSDATLSGTAAKLFKSIMKRVVQGNAETNAGKLAEDIGRLSVATGSTRDQIVEAILRRGEKNVIDQQRASTVRALAKAGGLAGYSSLPGVRN